MRTCIDRARTDPSADPFRDAVPKGVSANLCEALVGINGKNDQSSDELRIGFSWARSRPMAEPAIREIIFPSESFPILEEAARVLKAGAPPEESEIEGFVVKFLDKEGDQVAATLATFIDGEPRKVTLLAEGAERKKASDAFEKRIEIRCRGDLTKSGQLWTLRNPGRIILLNDDE